MAIFGKKQPEQVPAELRSEQLRREWVAAQGDARDFSTWLAELRAEREGLAGECLDDPKTACRRMAELDGLLAAGNEILIRLNARVPELRENMFRAQTLETRAVVRAETKAREAAGK